MRTILTDQNKLVVAVGGVTALAAGIYTTRFVGSYYVIFYSCNIVLLAVSGKCSFLVYALGGHALVEVTLWFDFVAFSRKEIESLVCS